MSNHASTSTSNTDEPILLSNPPFTLTPQERLVFSTILQAADGTYNSSSHDASHDNGHTLTFPLPIRIAGGWVRDKLLGLSSSDVDVALEGVSGVEFAHVLRDFLLKQEQQQQQQQQAQQTEGDAPPPPPPQHTQDNSNKQTHTHAHDDTTTNDDPNQPKQKRKKHSTYKIGIIAANPHQSKHLETATMTIHGISLDFVHLRAEETYSEHSRIPHGVEYGTPLQDALRRDFTMNALFYNLRQEVVEDYTRRGLEDLLQSKTLQTPLDPFDTFCDDPLRVLRAVRFAVRFRYVLSPRIQAAARSKEVQYRLMTKVSRERVGMELDGMLEGKAARPRLALEMLVELGLADEVFCLLWEEGVEGSLVLHGNVVAAAAATTTTWSKGARYEECHTLEERKEVSHAGFLEGKECVSLIPHLAPWFAEEDHSTTPPTPAASPSTLQSNNNNNTGLGVPPQITTLAHTRLVYLAILLSPFRHLTYNATIMKQHKLKKRKQTRHSTSTSTNTNTNTNTNARVVTQGMLREGIKLKNKDLDELEQLFEGLDGMLELLTRVMEDGNENKTKELTRLDVAMVLRLLKHVWVSCLWVGVVVCLRAQGVDPSSSPPSSSPLSLSSSEETPSPSNTKTASTTTTTTTTIPALTACQTLLQYIADQELDQCWTWKPLCNGRDLMQALNLSNKNKGHSKKTGPLVGKLMEIQWKWRVDHPKAEKEECLEFLKEKFEEMVMQEEEEGEEDENGGV